MSKLIPLTKGRFAIVDDEDFDFLMQWHWCTTHYGYACRSSVHGETMMHRLIMKSPKGFDTDHIDGNPLNNQKSNLRICSHRDNIRWASGQRNSSSRFKGVTFDKQTNKWRASIKIDGKYIGIMRCDSEEDAARAYDAKAHELFGNFARLNFPFPS